MLAEVGKLPDKSNGNQGCNDGCAGEPIIEGSKTVMLFWTEADYLVAMAIWGIALTVSLKRLLIWRRQLKTQGTSSKWLSAAFSLWMLLAVVTAFELGFAAFADGTDAFNMTNISRRWFRRHIEPQRTEDGFRNRQKLALKLPAGTQRICFLGDSFTIGHGLRRMEDRFSDRIEVALNAESKGTRWECANLGECGWEISLIEGMLKATLTQGYEAKVVVYCYMLNDIEGYDKRTTEAIKAIQQQVSHNPLLTRTYFLNWLGFRWQQYQAGRTVDYFPHLKDSYHSSAWEAVKASLRRMRDRANGHDVELRVAIFPFMHNLGPDYPFRDAHRKLVEFCREEQIPVLDLEPLFTAHRSEGLVVGMFDNHPNERANELAADAMLKELLSDLRE